WVNLYVIRHGESTWNSQNRIQGHSDPGLSKLGRLQARLLAKRFKKIKIDKIYASPLARALETAEIMAKALGRKVIKDAQFKEIKLGDWEGKTPEEINRLYQNRYDKWLRLGPTKIRIPKAEGVSAFRSRAAKAFYETIKKNPDKDVMVVTHGGVISALLAHILGADFDKLILHLYLPNTCVTVVSFHNKRASLVHIADTFHLSKAIKVKGVWPASK
ncbi:MAG: histidine phosphatase family protein, partial [Candidatus Omnitrophica bacterium]|nr:histidine phosphatase family protein [Candidatus Omnitrophota bacterium]